LGFESPVPGQSSEFGGAHRFERPIEACELAPGLENTPQRRVSLESNERNFLSLSAVRIVWGMTGTCRRKKGHYSPKKSF
jgi:hypothetical protein